MDPERDLGQQPSIDYFGEIHRGATGKPYEKAQEERGAFVDSMTERIVADLNDPTKAEAARKSLRELVDRQFVSNID